MKKFDFNDILIAQGRLGLNSRGEANIFDEHGMLPIITAPMDTVVDEKNAGIFHNEKINVCIPRTNAPMLKLHRRHWTAITLEQASNLLNFKEDMAAKVCIDVANGNMPKLHETIIALKQKFPKITIMSGCVGSVGAFIELSNTGVDYIRVGIGNGSACLTTEHTGVGYPMGSLIQECFRFRHSHPYSPKIVADGGFKKYSDIIKALALGADYVVLGGILNQAFESSGGWYVYDSIVKNYIPIDPKYAMDDYESGETIYKKYRGMSTKEVQRKEGKLNIKSSEGTNGYRKVEYTLKGWVENFSDYLSSAMAYVGAKTLVDFQRDSKIIFVTQESHNRFNK